MLIVCWFKKPFSVRVHKSITAASSARIMGIELTLAINMWPGTPKDMIDHLIARCSTSLVVVIDTITHSGLSFSLEIKADKRREGNFRHTASKIVRFSLIFSVALQLIRVGRPFSFFAVLTGLAALTTSPNRPFRQNM